jgi:hypothetical protein
MLSKGLSKFANVRPEDARKLWERFRPMDPAAFARAALDCVAQNQAIIVIPRWYRALWFLERVSPRAAEGLATLFHERAKGELERLITNGAPTESAH